MCCMATGRPMRVLWPIYARHVGCARLCSSSWALSGTVEKYVRCCQMCFGARPATCAPTQTDHSATQHLAAYTRRLVDHLYCHHQTSREVDHMSPPRPLQLLPTKPSQSASYFSIVVGTPPRSQLQHELSLYYQYPPQVGIDLPDMY